MYTEQIIFRHVHILFGHLSTFLKDSEASHHGLVGEGPKVNVFTKIS